MQKLIQTAVYTTIANLPEDTRFNYRGHNKVKIETSSTVQISINHLIQIKYFSLWKHIMNNLDTIQRYYFTERTHQLI